MLPTESQEWRAVALGRINNQPWEPGPVAAFDGSLPYPLNAYLDLIQYAKWSGPQDTPRLIQELLSSMAGEEY